MFHIDRGKSFMELATERILGWDSATYQERVREFSNLPPGGINDLPMICVFWRIRLTGEEAGIMLNAHPSLWPTREEVAKTQPLKH